MRRYSSILCLAFISAASLPAQQFEVASIKTVDMNSNLRETCGSKRGRQGGPGTISPERVTYTCQGVARLIVEAYGFEDHDYYRFPNLGQAAPEMNIVNLTANLKPGTTMAEYQAMLSNLLTERFHLKAHKELRENTVYELKVGKNGHTMKVNTANPETVDLASVDFFAAPKDTEGFAVLPSIPGHVVLTGGKIGHARLVAANVPTSALIDSVRGILKAPIADHTGLTGKYDFQLDFDAGYAPPVNMNVENIVFYPLLPEAFRKQLGLELEKAKGQVEFIVVDSIDQKPTEN